MRIYLSGPITGVKNHLLNFLRAENTIRTNKKFKSCDVVNPARLEKKMAEEMDMEIYELQENGELKPLFKNEYICKGNEIKYYA